MKNSTFQCLLFCLLSFAVSAQKSTSIFFDTKQTVLSAEAKSQLMALVAEIKPLAINKISIVGFADADGSDALNQNLSEQRAVAVKAFLVEKGIFNQLITAVGRGKAVADKDKNRSRRVDIVVEFRAVTTPPIAAKPAVVTPSKTVVAPSKPVPNIMALYQSLGTPIQNFKIATNRDTLLRGSKGTAIFIPKNVFQGVPPNATVDFRLKEAYSTADILSDNLSTTSGDKILQTGGMIYTDAQFNGKPVQLKDNLLVSFNSAESRQEGMQIYSGRRNAKENGKIDWQLQPKEVEETIAYRTSANNNPFLLRTGESHLAKFAEWVDVSSCGVYFKNSNPQKYTRTNDLNATCTTILAYVEAQPSLKIKSIEEVHRLIFSDMYSFYNVNNLAELQKQDGRRWDSLLAVREQMYDVTVAGDARRQRKADSLKEVNRKNAILQAEYMAEQNRKQDALNKIERFFPVQSFGWTNLDGPFSFKGYIPSVVTTDIPTKDSELYSILLTFPKQGSTIRGRPNVEQVMSFGMLPKNWDGYMVGMKTENNQAYLAIQKIKVDNMKVTLEYKPVTAAEIKQAFSELK